MEYKVGDKVRTKFGVGYEGTIVHVNPSVIYPYVVKITTGDCDGLKFSFREDILELAKPDLRDLLKVGYKVKTTVTEAIIKNQTELNSVKSNFNEKLDSSVKGIGLIAIYKPKYNGVKPMEWELVWKREEKLYTLQCPLIKNKLLKSIHGRLHWSELSTKFTKEEIDNLPNQEFIKTLIKEEVK